MGSLLILITVFLFGLIQATGLDYLAFMGVKPDLILICVLFFSLYFDMPAAIKAAIFGGLMKDLTSGAVFGSNIIAFLLCAFLISYYGRRLYKERTAILISLGIIAAFLAGFLEMLAGVIVLDGPYIKITVIRVIYKSAIYTGIVLPFAFFIFRKIFNTNKKMRLYNVYYKKELP